MNNDTQEIWIPSEDRIANRLIEDLKMSLSQDTPSKEAAFMLWLNRNAAALAYIGKGQVTWIKQQVVKDLGLTWISDEGYGKRQEEP